uniref:Uncharacterized protein n=1 Tax=Arundo donax TaxID=35708 RepID=A0A0A9DX80_ARUDO
MKTINYVRCSEKAISYFKQSHKYRRLYHSEKPALELSKTVQNMF